MRVSMGSSSWSAGSKMEMASPLRKGIMSFVFEARGRPVNPSCGGMRGSSETPGRNFLAFRCVAFASRFVLASPWPPQQRRGAIQMLRWNQWPLQPFNLWNAARWRTSICSESNSFRSERVVVKKFHPKEEEEGPKCQADNDAHRLERRNRCGSPATMILPPIQRHRYSSTLRYRWLVMIAMNHVTQKRSLGENTPYRNFYCILHGA